MKKVLRKSNFMTCILILIVVCLGVVLAGDVIVQEGIMEAEIFKTTGCTTGGINTIAFGYETNASGHITTALGCYTTASGGYGTAMGYGTEASGGLSTAMGWNTTASGMTSTAMGYETDANGTNSTAMGYATDAIGENSTAMGESTTASGFRSTAMGYKTTASGDTSTAMGYNTTASGNESTALGNMTTASGNLSTALGFLTTASGDQSLAAGFMATASGHLSVAIGDAVVAGASRTTAIGKNFTNNVQDSFAVGYDQKYFSVESGLVHVYGKLTVDGDFDPKTLELELQERNGVIERYEKYVTPDKKSGVVYINSETKQIEVYYPYEGVIRNIQGQTIYSLPSIRINNDYETYYVFDTLAGQVVEKQRAVYDKYRIKDGIEFNSSTGQFIDKTTKQIIPKEEATELYR